MFHKFEEEQLPDQKKETNLIKITHTNQNKYKTHKKHGINRRLGLYQENYDSGNKLSSSKGGNAIFFNKFVGWAKNFYQIFRRKKLVFELVM